MESPVLRTLTRRKEENGESTMVQHQNEGTLRRSGEMGIDDEEDENFEEGRHMKVALSAKGVCVSQLWESRKKKERFEQLLNKVINGKLMPAPTRHDLIEHKEKMRRYKQLVTRSTPVSIGGEEEPWWQKTLRETEEIFRTSRTSQSSLKPVRIIQPMSQSQHDVFLAPQVRTTILPEDDVSTPEVLTKASSIVRKPRVTEVQQPSIFRGKFDPYKNSPWTFQERKCFFTSNFVPPHQRNILPTGRDSIVEKDVLLVKKYSEENVEQDV